MIVSPLPLTLDRWRRVSGSADTLLRALEHERIAGLRLNGRVLDIGGGTGFRYTEMLEVDGTIDSVNINPAVHPTMIADLNKPLPIASATYDHVISFNTFEHVREDWMLLVEMLRVLKPGGGFLVTVPFLFRMHGSPFDFHRHTATWWEHAFTSCGIGPQDVRIEPLVWGPLSSALSQLPWFRAGVIGGSCKRLITLLELAHQSARRGGVPNGASVPYALGYLIRGKRTPARPEA